MKRLGKCGGGKKKQGEDTKRKYIILWLETKIKA